MQNQPQNNYITHGCYFVNLLDLQFALSTFIFLHNGTFKGATLFEYLGEWFLVNEREMCFYNNSDSEIQTSSSEGVFHAHQSVPLVY